MLKNRFEKVAVRLCWVSVLVLPVSLPLAASEPDNFTRRPTTPAELADTSALNALNAKTNEVLASVLPELKDCSLESLNLTVKNALGGGEIGKLENWADEEETLKKTVVPYSQSIYADAGIMPSTDTSLLFGTRSIGLALDGIVPSVVLNGHYVGVDKLGHFFDQGYAYYEEIYLRHKDPVVTIENYGLEDEDGGNGMASNGIRSYGDMAANFQGYLFWRDVAAGPNAFFSCRDGKYERTSRKFDWADYVSDAWDEAINCSEFSPSVQKVVDKALTGLAHCPVSRAGCQSILEQTCGFTYLSPGCMPYVKVAAIPDAACARVIKADQAAQACTYEPGFWRGPYTGFIADNVDAAGTMIGNQGRHLQRNIKKLLDMLPPIP
jgi:hypothetical protein